MVIGHGTSIYTPAILWPYNVQGPGQTDNPLDEPQAGQ